MLITLRDLRDGEGLVSHLLARLGIHVHVGASDSAQTRRVWEQRVLHRYLDRVSALVLVDGLDEADPVSRRIVESELREMALAKGNHRIFLTCRTAEYNLDLRRIQAHTIRPLTDGEIRRFAIQWLGEERGAALVEVIRMNPYSGTEVLPLTLGHLCALYERDGALPNRPIDVYEAIVSLLVEEWDRQRGVRRVSQYADFSPRKKERFLQAVAFELAMAGRKGAFRHDDLHRVYQRIAPSFELPPTAEDSVVLEVESHTGLIHQSGYRRYEYVHLVIQEFLCAMHAQRTPNAIAYLVPNFPNEVALMVAYSMGVDAYLEEVLRLLDGVGGQVHGFVTAFVARLSIEGVEVTPSPRTGWVLLIYLGLLSTTLASKSEHFAYAQRDALRFFWARGIKESLELALGQARLLKSTDSIRVFATEDADVPVFLTARVREAGLRIHHRGGVTGLLPDRYLRE